MRQNGIVLCVALGLLGGCVVNEAPCEEACDRPECADTSFCTDASQPADAGTEDGGDGDAGPCGGCGGDTPLCRASDGTCVACLGDGDCDGARCDTDAGECVECLDDSDCAEPGAARCNSGECVGCTDSEQCAGISGTEVCDVSAETCVECTASDRSACGVNVCDGSSNTCTDREAGSQDLCQECVADAECQEGQLCVPMSFDGTDVGQFCLWRQDASGGPGGACINVRPYRETEELTSVDGVTTNVCSLRLTTCAALNQFDMRDCTVGMPPSAATDEECGVSGVDDGLCRVADVGVNRCTVPCASDDDCVAGISCSTSAPRYCEF